MRELGPHASGQKTYQITLRSMKAVRGCRSADPRQGLPGGGKQSDQAQVARPGQPRPLVGRELLFVPNSTRQIGWSGIWVPGRRGRFWSASRLDKIMVDWGRRTSWICMDL